MNQVCSKRGIILALIVVLAAAIAFGQSDLGSIAGFVKDPSGSTVPNAKVTVRNQSGLERTANTNESGYFIITNIPAGTYYLELWIYPGGNPVVYPITVGEPYTDIPQIPVPI